MNPSNKIELIEFLKEDKENIVGMCGDGANDCGALLASDIGISINQKENSNITAHFHSKNESIMAVNLILSDGKACYENNMNVLKFNLTYSLIQYTSEICLYLINNEFTNFQYFYVDFFIVLCACMCAAL